MSILLSACGGGGGSGGGAPTTPTPPTTPTLERPNLANASAASLTVGTRATITFTNNGGGSLISCAVSPPLPAGLAVSRTSDNTSCRIIGTPDAASSQATYTVTASNATGADATLATVSIAVDSQPQPAASNVSANSASIRVTSNAAGTAFVVFLADESTPPAAADIKAAFLGGGGERSSVVAAGSAAVTAGSHATVNLAGLAADTSYDAYIVVELGDGIFSAVTRVDVNTLRVADADSNGLIEIGTLAELNNVRHDLAGTSYRAGPAAAPSTVGCPVGGCFGYELTADLDFDSDRDGSTWVRNADGSFTLDTGDHHADYFDIADGGWLPIGDDIHRFTAVFDGRGHTVAGLATMRGIRYIGLFGHIGTGAEIRNLGLVGNLAKHTANTYFSTSVGSLVGFQSGGAITASYATGSVEGEGSLSHVGGLVGYQYEGRITASYFTGRVEGGISYLTSFGNHVGGLVGYQSGGSITASYSAGRVEGGTGYDGNWAGGLVGYQSGGSITASYATGSVEGGTGAGEDNDVAVGGLVGYQSGGAVIASYATGSVGSGDGGEITLHADAGTLIGLRAYRSNSTITASWGFGSSVGRIGGIGGSVDDNGNSDLPNGVTSAAGLTGANVPDSWHAAASSTLGAWDFGTSSQNPALNYADYDGATMGTAPSYTGGHLFHCDSDLASTPDGASIIPDCGTLIPGQRELAQQSAFASGSIIKTGTRAEAQALGSIRINGVVISGDYLNFLMVGGDADAGADSGVGADVGITLVVAGTGTVLASYSPDSCASMYTKGDQQWAHFDVSALAGMVVDIEIRDQDVFGDCGSIVYDHFHQSGRPQGQRADTADQPDLR